MSSRRVIATCLALVALTAACGDDDEASPPAASEPSGSIPAPSSPVTSAGGTLATEGAPEGAPEGGDGPNATLSPELPDELKGEVGPVEVAGTALPRLGNAAIAADPALGQAAPTLIGEDFDGETVRVDAVSEGPTMVVFLAHWCPHCNNEVPRLNELRDAGRFPEGLNIVAVSTGISPGRPNFPPSEWIEDVGWTYPVIADGIDFERQVMIAADAYGVDAFPFTVLVDGDGTVAARWSGESEPDEIISRIESNLTLP